MQQSSTTLRLHSIPRDSQNQSRATFRYPKQQTPAATTRIFPASGFALSAKGLPGKQAEAKGNKRESSVWLIWIIYLLSEDFCQIFAFGLMERGEYLVTSVHGKRCRRNGRKLLPRISKCLSLKFFHQHKHYGDVVHQKIPRLSRELAKGFPSTYGRGLGWVGRLVGSQEELCEKIMRKKSWKESLNKKIKQPGGIPFVNIYELMAWILWMLNTAAPLLNLPNTAATINFTSTRVRSDSYNVLLGNETKTLDWKMCVNVLHEVWESTGLTESSWFLRGVLIFFQKTIQQPKVCKALQGDYYCIGA